MSYWRFGAMIATSTLLMFGLMYIHTYTWDHVYFSETRAWMTILMGAVMAMVMLAFMLSMYKRRGLNLAIVIGAALAFAASVWLVRSQATVTGADYMQAMIPHHSIAILTSERADIEDPRVRKLADEIIEAQRKEIAEMKYLVRALERGDAQAVRGVHPPAAEVPAREAVRTADLATTDLESITGDELGRTLGSGPTCQFRYGREAAVVAAATPPDAEAPRGVIKLHGRLVPMVVRYPGEGGAGFALSSDDVSVTAAPYDPQAGSMPQEAEAMLRIGTELEVGYGGFYACAG